MDYGRAGAVAPAGSRHWTLDLRFVVVPESRVSEREALAVQSPGREAAAI